MGLIVLPEARTRQPQTLVGANPYWCQRGLKSLYSLVPGIWQINQVTGLLGGAQEGTGITFVNGKLRTPGVTSNGARLDHGLALNIALPITLVVGWTQLSGAVSWSLLSRSTDNWNGWYSQGTAVKTSDNNSFDGAVDMLGGGSYAICHANASSIKGASTTTLVQDTTATAPTIVGNQAVYLGWAQRGSSQDNPAVAEFTHFGALQADLDFAELRSLAANPWQLWAPEPRRLWAPSAAYVAPPVGTLGQFDPEMRLAAWF